jgi:hypothetical protein
MSKERRKKRRRERDRWRTASTYQRKNARAQGNGSRISAPNRWTRAPAKSAGAHVVLALASMGEIHGQTLDSLQVMVKASRKAASVEIWGHSAYPVGRCRNKLVEMFLADAHKTHLLFADTDMVLPENGVDLLLETGAPLVCGPAPICRGQTVVGPHDPVPQLTTNIMDAHDPARRGQPVAPDDPHLQYDYRDYGDSPDEPFHCDASGMSFCLIAREILERMPPPWFSFVDCPNRRIIGEDVYFFRKASQLGYRLLVHPRAMCDHVKRADLTNLERLLALEAPRPAPAWRPTGPTPRTLVIVRTPNRWVDFAAAELIMRWKKDPALDVATRLIEADGIGGALARFLQDPAASDPRWERLLIVDKDVVPTVDTVRQLGAVDAPIVSAISRTLIDGRISFNFTARDPVTGEVRHPDQHPIDTMTEPTEVETVDLACAMIQRDTCKHVHEALRQSIDQAEPDRAFCRRFVALVREETGRGPMVVPLLVSRTADVGLLSLVKLKHQLQHGASVPQPRPTPTPV